VQLRRIAGLKIHNFRKGLRRCDFKVDHRKLSAFRAMQGIRLPLGQKQQMPPIRYMLFPVLRVDDFPAFGKSDAVIPSMADRAPQVFIERNGPDAYKVDDLNVPNIRRTAPP
jgi:hypothetical protein